MKKKIREWWREWRDSVGLLLLGLLVFAGLYLTKLGSLVPGNSVFEQPGFLGITTKQAILENIVFGPIKVLQFIGIKIDDNNATLLRLVSVACVLVALTSFYVVLRHWHTRRIACMGTVLFATSTYMLHLGRFSGHEAAYVCVVPLLLLIGIWLRSKRHVAKLPVALILSALLFYIPGVWFSIVVLAIIFRKRLALAWKFVDKKHKIVGLAGAVLVAMPLIYSIIRHPDQLARLLGIDRITDGNLAQISVQFLELPKQLFYRGPDQSAQWLVGTPILDIATVTLAVLGVFSYLKGRHPLRARLLGLLSLLGVLVIVTSMNATVALILPLVYVFTANGVAYLLQSWFTVFPRNPAARTLGVCCVLSLVTVISLYHMKRYYEAWPNAPATKQALFTRGN